MWQRGNGQREGVDGRLETNERVKTKTEGKHRGKFVLNSRDVKIMKDNIYRIA